jgi:O-antigen/teichoic acid export membrane protein
MIPYLKKLKNKLGETSTHLFKTFFVYGFIALTMIIIKVLIARLYGQEELGIFTYFFSLVSFIFLFTSFGLPEAITQTIVKEPSKLKSVLKYFFPLVLLTTAFFTTLTLIITYFTNLNPSIPYFGIAFVVYLIFYTLFHTTYSILRGFKKFVDASIYSLISRIFFIAFIITAFLLSMKFIYVLLGLSLALLIATIFSLPKIKKLIVKEETEIYFKKFIYLSFSLFLMQVGFYSLRFLSEIIIGYLVDFNSLGLYSAYGSITNVIRLVASVFPVVVLPMAVINKYKLKDSLKKILKILIPFSFVVLVLTYFLVPILYGPQYKTTYLPIALVISSTLLVIYAYINSVFVGENKFSKFYLKIIGFDFFLSLIINTALNIYFILKIGLIGAPIATAITIILKIILNSYGIKKLREKKWKAIQ